jgi:hypothetical protein
MTIAIVTSEEIPGRFFQVMMYSSLRGTRFRYELPVQEAVLYLSTGMYGARHADV